MKIINCQSHKEPVAFIFLKSSICPQEYQDLSFGRGAPIGGGHSLGSGDHRTIEAPLPPLPLPSGGSFLDYSHMVAMLKLKGIDGRAYCGTAVLLSVPCFAQGRRRPFTT